MSTALLIKEPSMNAALKEMRDAFGILKKWSNVKRRFLLKPFFFFFQQNSLMLTKATRSTQPSWKMFVIHYIFN
jgi:hypothetical protein